MPVRWVPSENIHLTLKFLGDVSIANLDMLTKILGGIVSTHRSFEVSAGGLGAFPKIHQPRVIWIGLEVPPELMAIQHNLELETARLGYTREERPFSPHLTLGRVSRNASPAEIQAIAKVLGTTKVGFLGATRVKTVYLFRSDLNPGGATYTRIFSAPLADSIQQVD
jgi:2'-5' RNA ligase